MKLGFCQYTAELCFTFYCSKWSKQYSQPLCFAVIPTYCDSATIPTLSNANSPTPNQTVDSITYFTCNNGYQSTGAVPPYFSCNAFNTTSGSWSAVTNSCQSKQSICNQGFRNFILDIRRSGRGLTNFLPQNNDLNGPNSL